MYGTNTLVHCVYVPPVLKLSSARSLHPLAAWTGTAWMRIEFQYQPGGECLICNNMSLDAFVCDDEEGTHRSLNKGFKVHCGSSELHHNNISARASGTTNRYRSEHHTSTLSDGGVTGETLCGPAQETGDT